MWPSVAEELHWFTACYMPDLRRHADAPGIVSALAVCQLSRIVVPPTMTASHSVYAHLALAACARTLTVIN